MKKSLNQPLKLIVGLPGGFCYVASLYLNKVPLFLGITALCFLTACANFYRNQDIRVVQTSPTKAYTNSPSRFVFPPRVGSFERAQIVEYDSYGMDVGVGYNDPKESIAMTVYVYPISQNAPNDTLNRHFIICKGIVLAQHAGALLVVDDPVQIAPAGIQHTGLRAAFTYTDKFEHKRQPLRSELYLFTHGQRFVKYRVTYPAGRQAEAELAIRELMTQLAWPPALIFDRE